jgi:predicted glycosyltransferase
MNILIDIGHPAHVHLFKNMAFAMQKEGHKFFFTAREGENETVLLDKYGFNYKRIGNKRKGTINKILGIFIFTLRILKESRKFKPDMFLSHGSMYAGYAAFLLHKPHIAVEDSGNMEQIKLYLPFCNALLSPDVLPVKLGEKHITYKGYHELMYLLPRYFTPNNDIYSVLGLSIGEPYAIVRFVSWEATHDSGQKGFNLDVKRQLVHLLSKKMRVFISGERKLPIEFESYRINIPFENMHNALANATIYVGEGATMASEAGVLGTPSFYVSTIRRCYTDDQEKYGTVFNFTTSVGLFEKVEEILSDSNIKYQFKLRSEKLIADKIDPTSFLIWFVENWPESFKVMKESPEWEERFR